MRGRGQRGALSHLILPHPTEVSPHSSTVAQNTASQTVVQPRKDHCKVVDAKNKLPPMTLIIAHPDNRSIGTIAPVEENEHFTYSR